jgi:hypothetical protein
VFVPDRGSKESNERGLERILGVGVGKPVAADAPHHRPVAGDEFGERDAVILDQSQKLGVGPQIDGASDERE